MTRDPTWFLFPGKILNSFELYWNLQLSCFFSGRYRPVDLRHMALLSHLHKILPPDSADLRLLATPPLILDWSSVAIHSMHETVPWTQIMYALNGSLVALCRADPKHVRINPLWLGDAIWCYKSGSTLAQVLAWCLTAPSHYLNQCLFIMSKVQWH